MKALAANVAQKGKRQRKPEAIVRKGYLKTHQTQMPERMLQEDLAALEPLTEDRILDELQERMRMGVFHAFVGDILVILNPGEQQDIYNLEVSLMSMKFIFPKSIFNLYKSLNFRSDIIFIITGWILLVPLE